MKSLSEFALAIQPSSTMAIDAMFKQMKAEGQDVIGFGAGEPDFPTPDHIKEAGIQAIQNNDTRYTPSVGTVELRKAICQRLKADCGVEYTPQQISVSNGAKPCVYVALRALINPGDEVILPSPYWVSYSELIKMTGGVPVIVETREADHFKLTAQELAACGVADRVIPEPEHGFTGDCTAFYRDLREQLIEEVELLSSRSGAALSSERYKKFRAIGDCRS